jgi:hypothetical protein
MKADSGAKGGYNVAFFMSAVYSSSYRLSAGQ